MPSKQGHPRQAPRAITVLALLLHSLFQHQITSATARKAPLPAVWNSRSSKAIWEQVRQTRSLQDPFSQLQMFMMTAMECPHEGISLHMAWLLLSAQPTPLNRLKQLLREGRMEAIFQETPAIPREAGTMVLHLQTLGRDLHNTSLPLPLGH